MAKKSQKPFRAPHDIQHQGKTYRKGEMMPAKYRRFFTAPGDKNNPRAIDKAAGIDAAAPNFGRFVMPHVSTFQGIISSISHSYLNPDEAIKNCPENALKMERDCFVMECIQARQRGVALLNWHIEPEDARNDKQKEIADIIAGIMQQIPNFMEMRRQLLEAVWYGRYAVQTRWGMVKRMGKKYWGIVGSRPIHGDKLAFRYDDGSGEYDENQIGIRVTGARMQNDVIQGNRKLEPTTWGMAYFLEPWERDLVILHKHMIRDAAFEDYISSGSIHGVGIRSFIYWTWLQMSECMAFLLEYIERTGQGIWIYYYPSGNDQAKQEVETTAEQANRSNVILMPRMSGDPALDAFGIERIDPSPQGAENLKTVIHEFFGHRIKRYVLGQTLSSESDSTGLGSGVADLQYNSYFEIIKYDATNLEETITQEIVKQIVEKNFPEWTDYNFKFKIDTESAEKEKKLASFRQAYDMGARIREADVMDAIGLGAPQDGDVVLQNPTIRQQERLWQQQMQQDGGMGGMPGMDGGMGGMGGDPNGNGAGLPPGDPNGQGGQMGPNGEDLNDLFGPLAEGSINAVAQGGGTQWQVQKYSKTGESKPAPTTPDSGKPTTKEQGNSNPIPAPSGAAPAGASAPPGAKPPSGGANAESAAPPSMPKPPKMPGMNPSGAGAGGSPAGTNDAPGGTAEIGKEAKPTGGLPSNQTINAQGGNTPAANNKTGDGMAPTPDQNPAATRGQGQPQTQSQQAQNPQGQGQQPQQSSELAAPPQLWNTPEFRAAQPQRQQFATQHLQKLTQTQAMPPSVGGMFRAMMASPNFKSNAEYITHDFAPQQAQSIHQELAAQAGRQYGGGYVADLSATHGPGAIGYTSPAGAVVITPPAQPGGKWLTHYSANTGVVQRAMSGQPAFGQAAGMQQAPGAAMQQAPGAATKQPPTARPGQLDEQQLAQFDAGRNTRSKVRADLSELSSQTQQGNAAPGEGGQDQFSEPEPTNPRQFADTAERLRAKKAALLDMQMRKFEAGKLSDEENARYERQLSMIDARIKNAGDSAKHHEPIYQEWTNRRAAWQQQQEQERAKREEELAKQQQAGQPAAPQPPREEILDPAKIREQHANLLAEWKTKADAGQLDRHQNAQYKTRVSALKDQLKNAEDIAKASQPKPKTVAELRQERMEKDAAEKKAKQDAAEQEKRAKAEAAEQEKKAKAAEKEQQRLARMSLADRQKELDRLGKEADETYLRTGKTLEGKPFHTITRDQFASETGLPVTKHKQFVIDAIDRGDELPPEVMREYSELAKDYILKREARRAQAERIKNAGTAAAGAVGPTGRKLTAAERKEREPYISFLKNQGNLTEEELAGMDLAALKAKREEVTKSNQERLRGEESSRKQKERGDIQAKEAQAKQRRGQIAAKLPSAVANKINSLAESMTKGEYNEDDHHNFIKSDAAHAEQVAEALAAYSQRSGADEKEIDRIVEGASRDKNRRLSMLEKVKHEIKQTELRQQNAAVYGGIDTSSPDERIDRFAKENSVDPTELRSAISEIRKTVIGKKPNREDPETLKRALEFMQVKEYKQSEDFWNEPAYTGNSADTPPEAFQEGPPEQPEQVEREPGMEDEEESAAADASQRDEEDSPLPFRKSLESAARIKYMRQQRPDLFAI